MTSSSVLAQGEFLHLQGHLAHAGRLLLSAEQLIFEPNELERIAGAISWHLPLSDIRRIEHLGVESVLVIEGEAGSHRYQGPASLSLYRRLLPLLVQLRVHDPQLAPLPSTGRVLVHAPATRIRRGAIDVAGHLWMTPGRLRFVPVGVGRLVGAGAEFDLAVSDIVAAHLDEVEGTIECQGTHDVHLVKSTAAGKIYALWQALKKTRVAEHLEGACYPARHGVSGGVTSGQLIVTSHRWRFIADTLRTGTDIRPVSADWDVEIDPGRAHALSAEPGHLTIHLEGAPRRFELLEAEQILDALPSHWARGPAPGGAALDEAGAYRDALDVERLALGWSWVIGADVLAEPILAGPVVLHLPERRLERHQLLLTSSAIVLLPDEGPGAERGAVVFRHLGGLDPASPELRRSRIDLQIGPQLVSLHPRGGRVFVERFWDQLPASLTSSRPRPAAAAPAGATLHPASDLQIDNRRESYRVAPVHDREGTLQVRLLPHDAASGSEGPRGALLVAEGERLPYVLKDVSPEGMGVWLDLTLPVGTRVEVQLSEAAASFGVHAVVVNRRPVLGTPGRYHTGLRITEPEGALRQRVQTLWTQMQRQRVATRDRYRDQLDGTAPA